MGSIELKDFSLRQGDFRLEIQALHLNYGELIAVCGNNGSGKSTFLAALAGIKAFSGEYLLDGQDFRQLSLRERARLLSLLPQEGNLTMPFEVAYVILTGRFPLLQGSQYRPEDFRAVEEALEKFDLVHLRHRPFHQLSGGEKQRVLLARTFVRQSPVVLLDEPFSAIDLKHQHLFLTYFKKEVSHKIIVAVMHDLGLALSHFQRFLFFREGRLLFDLPRHQLNEKILSEVYQCRIRLYKCKDQFLIKVVT